MASRRQFLGGLAAASLAAGGAGLVGCAGPKDPPVKAMERSWAVHYADLAAVARASDLVVIGRPTGERSIDAATDPPTDGEWATLSVLRITTVLKAREAAKGIGPGLPITVRQLGSPQDEWVGEELLRKDKTYLLALQPFLFYDDEPTGTWISTIGQVFYVRKGGDAFRNQSTDPLDGAPATIKESDAARAFGL